MHCSAAVTFAAVLALLVLMLTSPSTAPARVIERMPDAIPGMTLDPQGGQCGTEMDVRLTGFRPGEQVELSMAVSGRVATGLAVLPALPNGMAAGTLVVPGPEALPVPAGQNFVYASVMARGLTSNSRVTGRFRLRPCRATPTPSSTLTATATETATPTATASSTATSTPTPSATASLTATATSTPTATPTATVTPTASAMVPPPSNTPTRTATRTRTPTATSTPESAPTVVSTSPSNGATNVSRSTNIVINFSEPVNYTTIPVSLTCEWTAYGYTRIPSSGPTQTLTIDPTVSALPAGKLCTVRVLANQITDADTDDPPDNMVSDFVFSFTTGT